MPGRPATTDAVDRLEQTLRREISGLKELNATERAGDAKALELQAEEYERRLESLNNEAGRIQTVLGKSVPREVFDNYKEAEEAARAIARDQLQVWKDAVNANIVASETRTKTWGLVITIILTIISIAVRFINL